MRVFPICSLWCYMAVVYRLWIVYNKHTNKLAQVKGVLQMLGKIIVVVGEVIIFVFSIIAGWSVMEYSKYSLMSVVAGAIIPIVVALLFLAGWCKE